MKASKHPVTGITYDTGALILAQKLGSDIWPFHRRTVEREVTPVVPAPVLAQAWRGGPQVNLARFLSGCAIEPFVEIDARDVGRLLRNAGVSDIVDAAVVLSAAKRGDAIVTSDPNDIRKLAEVLGARVGIHAV